MRSIAVTKMGFYECEFNSQGVFLTMISDAEAKNNIGGPWYYMMPGQYVEGTSYLDSIVKTEAILTDKTIEGSESIITTISIPVGYSIDTAKLFRGTYRKEPKSSHTCSDFKWYYGLLEHYEYCLVCEKKR